MIMKMLLDLPCEASYVSLCRSLADTMLRRMGVMADDIEDLELILGEACANAVQHAYDTPNERYHVELNIHPGEVDVYVTDHGRGADPSLWNQDPTELRERGRGMHLVRALADRVEWQVENGTRIHAVVHLHYKDAEHEAQAHRMDGANAVLALEMAMAPTPDRGGQGGSEPS